MKDTDIYGNDIFINESDMNIPAIKDLLKSGIMCRYLILVNGVKKYITL